MMKPHLFIQCILCVLLMMPVSIMAKSPYLSAVEEVKQLILMPIDDEISGKIIQFEQLDIKRTPTQIIPHLLFDTLHLQNVGNQSSEFIATMALLFSFTPETHQQNFQEKFDLALKIIDEFRHKVNKLVKMWHPGFQLNASALMTQYQGDNIVIGVFDLFDEELLNQQRQHYPHARITEVKAFGNPVTGAHGNGIIDIILSIAPNATIVAVSCDTKHYNQAMKYLSLQQEIAIINMSRTFLETNKQLDEQFKRLLDKLLTNKIVTKSLGNTGSDLNGVLSPIRLERGLPPVGNLFSYDLALIQQFMQQGLNTNHLLFGINGNLLKDNVALTATIPGNNHLVSEQSFTLLADGVFTYSSDNFESGSSYSAPQLAAIAALLWQALPNDQADKASQIIHALKATSKTINNLPNSTTGQGTPNADNALKYLTPFIDIINESV